MLHSTLFALAATLLPCLLGHHRFVRGHHSNFIMVSPPWLGLRLIVAHFFPEWSFPEKTSRGWFTPLGERVSLYLRETGYWHIQATKPDTLGLALTDSPAGLAAYILDKFPFSTNPDYINYQDGKLTERFEMDDLLNNIMTYWIPGSFVSCMRSYKELLFSMPDMMKYGQFVRGHHNNMLNVQPPLHILRLIVGSYFPSLVVSSERDQKLMFPAKEKFFYLLRETGYMHIQATKPDTVGHALTDSPAGLATYILEKFSTWTDSSYVDTPDGRLTEKFDLDDLLNNVMVYWISRSITTSMRLYKETFGNYGTLNEYASLPNSVPLGYASFPHELAVTPENWLSYKYKNVISYTAMPDGGHFGAFEQPKLLAEDLRQFTTKVEKFLEEKKE